MTTEQIITIVSQLGAAGVLLLVLVKLVAPMAVAAVDRLTKAIDNLASATTGASERTAAALADFGERLARMEGSLAHLTRDDATPPPLPVGSRDHDPIALRPRGR